MNLFDKLNQTSSMSRLNAVDAAYAGSPYAGSNFTAKWQGFNEDGLGVVKYLDQNYTGQGLSNTYTKYNAKVLLRVAQGRRTMMY